LKSVVLPESGRPMMPTVSAMGRTPIPMDMTDGSAEQYSARAVRKYITLHAGSETEAIHLASRHYRERRQCGTASARESVAAG
jgi:hypothetical protein